MNIDGKTKTCLLLGNPVEHTVSPLIHEQLALYTNLNMAYIPCKVDTIDLEEAVKGAYALNILGLNVTIPHKEAVIPYLCDIDELAAKIGAVNTLVRTDKGYKGYNTDMPGLLRAMQEDGISLEKEDALLLGAGGVARAVGMMLASKVKSLIVMNRTIEKAESIVNEVNQYAGRDVAKAMLLSDYDKLPDKKYLVIQATNVGMYPKCQEAVIMDKNFFDKIHTCYDLIYNPSETLFMKLTKQAGGKAYNGLKMLIYQGVIAFELWNHVKIDASTSQAVFEKVRESL